MKQVLLLITLCFSVLSAMTQEPMTGRASYYSKQCNGRKTASGEYYFSDSMTCAHKNLPFGTLLRVYNPRNKKEVVVRVTDRGPYRSGFILDLSYAAAKELDMLRAGHIPVEVTILSSIVPPLKSEPAELPHMETAYTQMVDMRKHKWPKDSTIIQKDSTTIHKAK